MNAWKKVTFLVRNKHVESLQNFLPNPYAFLMIGLAWVVETDAIRSTFFFEGIMLKLKLQYFGYLMRRADSLEKTLMLGGIGGRRRRG